MMNKFLFFDVESYPNFFMVGVLCDGMYRAFTNPHEFERFVNAVKHEYIFVGFNNYSFDDPMVIYWMKYKSSPEEMKYLSDTLIKNTLSKTNKLYSKLNNIFYLTPPTNGIYKIYINNLVYTPMDLMNFENSAFHSLKNCQLLLNIPYQKLPFNPNKNVDSSAQEIIIKYCHNDLKATESVFNFYKKNKAVDVRLSYMGLFDRAGVWTQARIAEELFLYLYNCNYSKLESYKELKKRKNPEKNIAKIEVNKLKGIDVYKFSDEGLIKMYNQLLDNEIIIKDYKPDFKNTVECVDELGNNFTVGCGGLHNEAPVGKWVECNDKIIVNVDATSFWPFIIATLELGIITFPYYYKVMTAMLNSRVKAKREGKKGLSEVLKLAVNSLNGKLGDRYSPLYSQELSVGLKVNGELMLLELWDMLMHSAKIRGQSIEMINANTDGIFFRCNKDLPYEEIFQTWSDKFNICLEWELYKIVCQTSVNDYFAVDYDGKLKTKGGQWRVDINKLDIKLTKAIAIKKAAISILRGEEVNMNEYSITDFIITASARSNYVFKPFNEMGTIALIATKDGVEVTKERFNVKKMCMDIQNLMKGFKFNLYEYGKVFNIDYSYYLFEAQKIVNKIEGK